MQQSTKILQVEQLDAETVLNQFEGIKETLSAIQAAMTPPKATVFMTREEVADFLKISLPTLWAWTKNGVLKSYTIGNKVRYIESEVIAAAKATGREAQV